MTRTAERAHGRRCAVALGVVLALASAGIHPVSAATLRVIDRDGAGEGFNDPTPVLPVGGNGGTTLGEQRLNAFQYAADIWGGLLRSDVEIRIGATFDPLDCDSMMAVLGQAGPDSGFRNFTGAPLADVMYSGALADMLAGMDLDPGQDDITATFNSAFGTTCPFPGSWYLGLDGAASGDQTDLVTVVLHELGHGLGFSTTVDVQTGRRAFGVDDAFMLHLEDNLTGELFPDLTDAQRREAIIATGLLRWAGPNVSAASGSLFSGADSRGHVNMYAPDPVVVGSSVVHFDTSVSPGQLMAPFLTVPIHDVGLTLPVFEDMGWQRDGGAACAGDCNGDGEVSIEELVDAVRIALDEIPISACAAADSNQDGEVSINEVDLRRQHRLGRLSGLGGEPDRDRGGCAATSASCQSHPPPAAAHERGERLGARTGRRSDLHRRLQRRRRGDHRRAGARGAHRARRAAGRRVPVDRRQRGRRGVHRRADRRGRQCAVGLRAAGQHGDADRHAGAREHADARHHATDRHGDAGHRLPIRLLRRHDGSE